MEYRGATLLLIRVIELQRCQSQFGQENHHHKLEIHLTNVNEI